MGNKKLMINLVEFLNTISGETRLRILVLLFSRELCVCDLSSIMEESQPNISRCLAMLRNEGFIKNIRHGKFIFYYINI